MHRIHVLFKLTSVLEFTQILFHHFILHDTQGWNSELQRLLIFAVRCADNGFSISCSNDIIILNWKIDQRNLQFQVRKYSRDILVFSQFFFDNDFTLFLKKVNTQSKINYIIDAGANIGCATLFLHLKFPEAKIICVEPEENNFNLLKKNIEINHLQSNIFPVMTAIWNEKTELNLQQRDWSDDGFHVMKKSKPDEVISLIMPTTIPGLMKEFKLDKVDLLKMDIEGAEAVIFRDLEHLKEFILDIYSLVIEVHDEFIKTKEIVSRLQEFRFKCHEILLPGQPSVVIANKKIE